MQPYVPVPSLLPPASTDAEKTPSQSIGALDGKVIERASVALAAGFANPPTHLMGDGLEAAVVHKQREPEQVEDMSFTIGFGESASIVTYTGPVSLDFEGARMPHGEGFCTFANGDTYQGSWSNGQIHGRGVLKAKNGSLLYSGEWQNSVRHGEGQQFDGKTEYDGKFANDFKQGEGTLLEGNKVVFDGKWTQGKQVQLQPLSPTYPPASAMEET